MATTWNLTEFSELEETVLTAYATPLKRHGKKGLPKAVFAVITTVAAITAAAMPVCAQASGTNFEVPHSVMAVAHSGIEQGPPLRSLFAGRFDAVWSESKENELLASLERAETFTKAELEHQTVDSIYFNHHEDVAAEPNRISREESRRTVRPQKPV